MDQGDLATVGSALAPSRSWLTPTRALLLMLGAVLVAVALSLLLGSSPAHAADGDGAGPGSGSGLGLLATPTSSLTDVTSSVTGPAAQALTATVPTALRQGIPVVKNSVDAAGDTVSTAMPAATPLVAPVVSTVDAALIAAQQLTAPARDALLSIRYDAVAIQQWSGPSASVSAISVTPRGSAISGIPATANSSETGGVLPAPILTSSSGAPFGAAGIVLGVVVLVLLAARRRLNDDAMPASPAFETDTSPA